jgi:undecaprenyl-diphosphatase
LTHLAMRQLPLRHAVALGLLHGPTELLPISSSGHTTLVAWLAGWPYTQLDPKQRKSFEVALHTGTAAALVLKPPAAGLGGKASFLLAALLPPMLSGYALGGQIERRLGTPATIAGGLLVGAVAMGSAEIYAKRVCASPQSARASDGLALGLAQALALIPGVSRSGATLAAARARGFSRLEADRLSWTIGLPVIAGASLLQGTRLVRESARAGTPRGATLPLVAGAASAFLSTLASSKALDPRRRARLLPACVAYRGALAAVVIRRMRDNTC